MKTKQKEREKWMTNDEKRRVLLYYIFFCKETLCFLHLKFACGVLEHQSYGFCGMCCLRVYPP